MVSVMAVRCQGSWREGSGATTLVMVTVQSGGRRQALALPSPRRRTPRPEWLRCYLGWPTLPGRRRWRTGGLRWRDWLSFGPPPPPLLKWPGSATAEHSYLERGAREGGVKPGERGWGVAGVAWPEPGQCTRGQHLNNECPEGWTRITRGVCGCAVLVFPGGNPHLSCSIWHNLNASLPCHREESAACEGKEHYSSWSR